MVLFSTSISIAQSQPKIDSLYILSYRNRFIPSVGLLSRNQEINIKASKSNLIFRTNLQNSLRFGATYKGLGLHLAFAPKFLNRGILTHTSFFNLRVNSFGRKFGYLFNMLNSQGFYISNADKLHSSFQSRYPEVPSMFSREYKLTTFYAFNHRRFSFRHHNTFNELQIKSAGTFVAGFSSRYFKTGLGETPFFDSLKIQFSIRGFESLDFGPLAGYAHSFVVFKQVYASLFLMTGPLLYWASRFDLDQTTLISQFGWNNYFNLNLGRNTERTFYGFSITGERKMLKLNEYGAETGLGTLWLFFGYRFGM